MTLQQLKYIITVAECGNITEAAERLFIAQPSLTAAIHSLEKEMGVTAFIRSNKGVELTRNGEVLPTITRSQPVYSYISLQSSGVDTSPLPMTGMLTDCFTARLPGRRG